MDVKTALERLREYKSEIPHLKNLHHADKEGSLWIHKVNVILTAAFGNDSDEYGLLNPRVSIGFSGMTEAEEQCRYIFDLNDWELGIEKILQKYEILGLPKSPDSGHHEADPEIHQISGGAQVVLRGFIAHGGDSKALGKLEEFLRALGVGLVIVEKEPSEGRSIGENVEYFLKQTCFAVVLATKGDIDGQTGELLPRGNILIEIGRCQERFPGKTIYLLEEGTKFPSNINEKVWERFTQDNMERAFIKIAKELRAFGIIKTG